ncbi:MAG: ABC transporter ATP-binding protein [Candidatus Omnitrophota bacterium]
MAIINFHDVWEMYRIKFVLAGKVSWENYWALKGISFKIEPSETIGIIGENGSGKTTILKIIAGLLKPDRGEVKVDGRVAGLLEMGAGFQPELTGRDNIHLNLSLSGMDPAKLEVACEKIISFADIGKFIDAPVKCYSQGMFVRLAFSAAIHVEPEILVIDDILAVGDEYFQRKCIKRIFELRDSGATIVCVTHDMHMLRKLCKRVLFIREGRVIKDDLAEKVIPFYAQMIGAKDTIAILTQGPFSVIFNNGRLFLNWKDKPVTSNAGGYTRFFVDGKSYHSFQADWEVQKESETRFVARGRLFQLGLTQIWKMEIHENSEVKWDVEIQADEPLDIQEGYLNLLLQKEYADWFTPSEKGHFPVIDENSHDWQPLTEKRAAHECMGVMPQEAADAGLPGLIFESRDSSLGAQGQVFNSDSLADCRVLQYTILRRQHSNVSRADQAYWFSGRILLDVSDPEQYLNDLQAGYAIELNTTKLVFEHGRCDITCKKFGPSAIQSIASSVHAGGRRYFSTLAKWKPEKAGPHKMIAQVIWPDAPFIQIWEIEAVGEDAFRLNVFLRVSEEVCVEQQMLNWTLSKEYTSWFYGAVEHDFPEEFLEHEVDVLQKCIRQPELGVASRAEGVPAAVMKVAQADDSFVKIFNADIFSRSREIRIYRIGGEGQELLLPGERSCFDAEISFGKKRATVESKVVSKIDRGELSFCFDRGQGRLYWKGKELTKELGFYTALRCQGRWHSSVSSAFWRVENVDDHTLMAHGNWLQLPLIQSWEIKITDSHTVELRASMIVNEDIEMDRIQTNIMLSERYDAWRAHGVSGILPPFKANIDDDWEVVYSTDNKEGVPDGWVAVSAAGLPEVRIGPCGPSITKTLNIVNSDLYHRGRVLQYLERNPGKLRPEEKIDLMARIVIQESSGDTKGSERKNG